jgi:hypothetical protein
MQQKCGFQTGRTIFGKHFVMKNVEPLFLVSTLVAALVQLASPTAWATDVAYGSAVGVVGTLGRSWGTECCFNGQERRTHFPTLVLDAPLNFVTSCSARSGQADMPEIGVTQMQLIIRSPDLWQDFEAKMNTKVRVICAPYHAFTGHHMTPVTCDVERIGPPNEP